MANKLKLHPRFGELLNQGLKQLAAKQHQSIGDTHDYVAEEIGYSSTALHTWRRGEHLPNTPETVERLAFIFVQQGGFDQVWVSRFLKAAQFESQERIEALNQELFGQTVLIEPNVTPTALLYIPQKTYYELIGRDDELNEAITKLNTLHQYPVLSIVGLGGMGKTALAHRIVDLCQRRGYFEHIVWRSVKTEFFESERILKQAELIYNFDEFLSDIGRQCGRLDITQLPPDQKKAAVKQLLQQKQVLIVLDNLETVADNEKLVSDIFQILGRSKLLITSRHHLLHNSIYRIELRGLSENQGVKFLRVEATVRNIRQVAEAEDKLLVEVQKITGGAPLAMKLVVGQMSRKPATIVLNTLIGASSKGPDYDFYRFIYWYSWDLLMETAQETLVDMSVFPPIIGGAAEDVVSISQVENNLFWPAMEQLILMSLVDRTGSLDQERYALHPLTYYFIRSDITQDWEDGS